MARSQFYDSVQDSSGNFVTTSEVTVYLYGTTTKATIYENESGSTQKANPFYPTDGFINFWAEPNSYDIVITDTANPAAFSTRTVRFDSIPAVSGVLSQTINDGSIVDGDINTSAAIAYNKLNLTGSIANSDIKSSAAISYSKLSLGLSIVNNDISTSAAIAQSKFKNGTVVSSLPSSPFNGDECYYSSEDGSGGIVVWHLKYRTTGSSAPCWDFIGGSPLTDNIANSNAISSTSYGAISTAGPEIIVPLTGKYIVRIGATLTAGGATVNALMSYTKGGTAASDSWSITSEGSTAFDPSGSYSASRVETLTAGDTLTAQYRIAAAGSGQAKLRWMEVQPIRVT